MPHAIVKGEVHTSHRDRTALADQLEGVDAVIRESMKQQRSDDRDLFYLLLYVGMKLFRNTIQRVFYASDDPVFKTAEKHGTAVHRMDTDVAAWNKQIADWKKGVLLALSGLLAYSTVSGISSSWLRIGLGGLLFVILYFLYAAVLTIPERDRLMVERVLQLQDEHGYDTVLIAVGDAHVEGIATRLRSAGWDVETRGSGTLFSRMVRPLMRGLRRIT